MSADAVALSAQTQELLLELYDRLESSLLRYLSEATPWVEPRHADLLTQLREHGAAQELSLRIIADIVVRRHLLPDDDGWPNDFATLHYLSLQFVIDRLVADQQAVAEIALELRDVWPESTTRDEIESVRMREAGCLDALLFIQRSVAKIAL